MRDDNEAAPNGKQKRNVYLRAIAYLGSRKGECPGGEEGQA